MPSWKDNLTDDEVTVLYKYKNQGKDSLTDDEVSIVYKYKDFLKPKQDTQQSEAMQGLASIEPEYVREPQKDPTVLEKLRAGAEAGISTLASPISAIGNIVGAGGELLGFGKGTEIAEKINSKIMPTPSTELGREYQHKIGRAIDPLNAVFPNLQMMHGLSRPVYIRAPQVDTTISFRPGSVKNSMEEAIQTKLSEKALSAQQTELFPPEMSGGKQGGILRDTQLAVDENGIPFDPVRSQEFRLTEEGSVVAQGDLFSGQKMPLHEPLPKEVTVRNEMTSGIPLEFDAMGRLRRTDEGVPGATPETITNTASTLDSAQAKVNTGQRFALSAEERISLKQFEKIQNDLSNLIIKSDENSFKSTFTPEKLQERLQTLEGVRTLLDDLRQEYASFARDAAERFNSRRAEETNARIENKNRRLSISERIQEKKSRELEESALEKQRQEEVKLEPIIQQLEALEAKLSTGRDGSTPTNTSGRTTTNSRSPLGGVGKKQGGAVNFGFGGRKPKREPTESLEEFLIRNQGRLSDSELTEIYNKFNPEQTTQAKQAKAVGNVPGLSDIERKYSTKPVESDPLGKEAVSRIEQVGTADMPTPHNKLATNFLSAGRLQAFRSKSPIVHEGIGFITSVKDHYRVIAAEILSEIGKALYKYELDGLPGFNKEYSHERAQKVLSTYRDNEFNPSFDPTTVFSGHDLTLFRTVEKAFSDTHGKLNQRLKELNPNRPDLPKIPYYFTSFFTGDYSIPVFNRSTGQFMYNLRETTLSNAKKAKEWVDSQQDIMAKEPTLYRQSDAANKSLAVNADFEMMLDLLGKEDPATMAMLQRLSNSQAKISMNTAGMPNRFKEKSGRLGSIGDKPWLSEKENLAGNKEAMERYFRGVNEWLANTQISSFMKALNESKSVDAPNALALINDYGNYVTGGKNSLSTIAREITDTTAHMFGVSGSSLTGFVRRLANAETALLIGYYSPRAIVQNVLQPIQVMPPRLLKLSQVEGIPGNVTYALFKGLFDGILDITGHWTDSKSQQLQTVSRQFKEKNHIVDAHLLELGNTFTNARLNSLYDLVANKSLSWTEQLSRSIAFSQFQAFLESAGYPSEKAMDMAKNLTHETMVNYESYAKPQVFGRTGIAGEIAGRLQTFKANNLTQTIEFMADAKSKNPKHWAPLAAQFASTILLAGATGMIGMDIAELLWKGLQKLDSMGEVKWLSENSLKGMMYKNLPNLISRGALTEYTGVDFSGSFAQNLVSEDPLLSIAPIVGTMSEQVQAPINIASNSNMDRARGIQAITPTSVKSAIEDKLLTNNTDVPGEKQVVSPRTGKTVWKGKGTQQLSNLRSKERAEYQAETREFQTFSNTVEEAKNKVEDKATKTTVDLYQKLQSGKEYQDEVKTLEKQLNRYLDFGGDPTELWSKIETQLEELGVGDQIISYLSKEIGLNKLKQAQEALDIQNRRQERRYGTQ